MDMLKGCTVRERVEQCLEQIERFEDQIFAWKEVFHESARQQADELDQDDRQLPLKGLVVGIKDIFDLVGRPPGNGVEFTLGELPKHDAAVVRKLKQAGAVIIGMTQLPQLCLPLYPCETRNPHNVDRTPGGSSSGSAAAVAAEMIPASIGSQTNGSTIRPATFCGVYGFKPSSGAVSSAGMQRMAFTLDHPGFFSRDPAVLMALYEATAGYDPNDPQTSQSLPLPVDRAKKVYRIGVWDISETVPVEEEMKQAVREYARDLANEGNVVEDIDLPGVYAKVTDIFRPLFQTEIIQRYRRIWETDLIQQIHPSVVDFFKHGNSLSLETYFRATEKRESFAIDIARLFYGYDFILLPGALGTAPAHRPTNGDPITTTLSSLLGLPAATVPYGTGADGLPLGVQVIAKRGNDLALLEALKKWPAKLVRPDLIIA